MANTTTDPVCGMTIQDIPTVPRTTHRGRTYVFCSNSCRDQFVREPDRYARTGNDAHV